MVNNGYVNKKNQFYSYFNDSWLEKDARINEIVQTKVDKRYWTNHENNTGRWK